MFFDDAAEVSASASAILPGWFWSATVPVGPSEVEVKRENRCRICVARERERAPGSTMSAPESEGAVL